MLTSSNRWIRGALLAATVIAGSTLEAQDAAGWRYWGAQDGLPESFVNSSAVDLAGAIWSIHGTSGMSRMDGYSVDRKIPLLRFPRTLLSMPDGIWTLDVGGLQRLRGREWEFHPLDELKGIDTSNPPKLRALGPDRLLIVNPKWLTGYDPATRHSTRLISAAQTSLGIFGDAATGPNGTVLVTSASGLALCAAAVSPASFHCIEYGHRQLGLKQFHDPQVDGDGFLVAGESPDTREERLIGFDGKVWRTVWQGGRTLLRGWRAGDGELWVQNGGDIFCLRSNGLEAAPRQGALLGTIYGVQTDKGGVLLVGTDQGLARYSPPLWQTPPLLSGVNSHAISALEDHKGRLWLFYADQVVGIEQHKIHRFALPKDATLYDRASLLMGDGAIVSFRGPPVPPHIQSRLRDIPPGAPSQW